jgi:nitrate/nitrite transporter NarK
MAPVAYKVLSDRPGSAEWLTPSERRSVEGRLAAEHKLKSSAAAHTWKIAIREREVLTLAAIYGLWLAANYGLLFFLPTMVGEITALPLTSIGLILAAISTAAFIALILFGKLSDRSRDKKLLALVPLVIGAAALIVCTLTHQNATVSIVLLGVTVVGFGSAFGVFWTLPTLFLSETSAAVSIGLIGAIGNLGGFIGPSVSGYLRSSTGAFTSSNILFVVLAVSAALLILTLKKTRVPSIESIHG